MKDQLWQSWEELELLRGVACWEEVRHCRYALEVGALDLCPFWSLFLPVTVG